MKASYKLKLEQHQRRLGLTHKELNKYDRKHNDINLLKQLQLLEPKTSAPPPAPSGWYGTFTIYNYNNYYSTHNINITVEADTLELNPFETLILGESIEIIVSEENRLTSPSTLIKITYEVDEGGVLFAVYPNGLTYNWEISNETELYFTVDSGYIDDGTISLELVAANG